MIVAGGNAPGTVDGGRSIHAQGQPGPAPATEFRCDSTCYYDFAPGTEVKLWSHDGTPIVWGGTARGCLLGYPCDVTLPWNQTAVASFVAHRFSPAWTAPALSSFPITDEAGNMYSRSCTRDGQRPPTTSCWLNSIDPQGKPRFSIPLGSGPTATAAMDLRLFAAGLIFTVKDAVLSARSPVDGSVVWQRDYSDRYAPLFKYLGATASDGSAIFVAAGDRLAALDGSTGSVRWEIDQPANSALMVDESGNVYFTHETCGAVWPDSCRATLSSVDESGRLRWQRDQNASWVTSPAAVAAGVLLTEAGEIFDAATGALRGKLTPEISLGVVGLAGQAVITPDGKIIVANFDKLIAFDGVTGSRIWSAAAFESFWFTKPQLISSGVMLMDDTQVRVFALDGSSASRTWLEVLLGDTELLDNGLYVSLNSSAAFKLPGNPRLAEHGWIGFHGGPTRQNRAR